MRSFWKETSPPDIVLMTTSLCLKALVKETRLNVVVTGVRACGLEGTWCGQVSRLRLKGHEKVTLVVVPREIRTGHLWCLQDSGTTSR